MGEDSKTLNVSHFFPNGMLLFWSIGAHLAKLFLLRLSNSVSSHMKLADAQYLKLDMYSLTCWENTEFFLDVASEKKQCKFSWALCDMICFKSVCVESYAK